MDAQSKKAKFGNLSGPEKSWVIWHPFKAKKALEVSVWTLQMTDSIESTGKIGRDRNGGHVDAFKHTLWMAKLSQVIGQNAALKLGKAHEKGNYKSFKKGRKEDGNYPDKVSGDMDSFNNKIGVQIGVGFPNVTEEELIGIVLKYLAEGQLRIIKKHQGVFLTCSDTPIESSSLKGTWENDKCLVPSNEYQVL